MSGFYVLAILTLALVVQPVLAVAVPALRTLGGSL